MSALLLTVRETCQILGISRSTLHKLTVAGTLKPRRVLNAVRFRREDVEAFAAGGDR